MTILEKIIENMKAAMKSGDHARVNVLRFVLAGLRSAEKEKFAKEPGVALTDAEAISVLQKEVKRRKESIELFRKGNRPDLADKEDADLVIIAEYVPKELSTEEIEKIVDALRESGLSDFNALMRETMKEVKGRADGRAVGDVIKKKLG